MLTDNLLSLSDEHELQSYGCALGTRCPRQSSPPPPEQSRGAVVQRWWWLHGDAQCSLARPFATAPRRQVTDHAALDWVINWTGASENNPTYNCTNEHWLRNFIHSRLYLGIIINHLNITRWCHRVFHSCRPHKKRHTT